MSRPATPRREPRVSAFVATGALVGFLVGSAVYLLNDDNGLYAGSTALGYLAVVGVLIGALLGAIGAAIAAGRKR